MNEFTKDELEKIYFHMEFEPIELMNKIKNMIDNYCDKKYNPDCYCGQIANDGSIITKCGYCS